MSDLELERLLPSSTPLMIDVESQGRYFVIRKKVYQMVEGTIDSVFEYFILGLIFLNVLSFIIGTLIVEGDFVDGICVANCVDIDTKYANYFEGFELISVIVFTIEYIARLWAAMENDIYYRFGPLIGRLKYALTVYCVVDLISILPYWLNAIGLIPEIEFSTSFRMVRLARLLKADKYVNAFSLLGEVMYENGPLLLATSYYAVLILVVSSTLLYFTERDNPLLQRYFQSIPHAMFPTVLMLTGEFPLLDFTPAGSFIAAFVAVVAVAIFAIPTAILGSGFVKAVERSRNAQLTVDI